MAALPGMKARGQGHIGIIASAACFAGFIGFSAYCPSKYAVRGLADCLRNELLGHGIGVTIMFPSTIDTAGLAQENKTKPPETHEIEGTASTFSPEQCAAPFIDAVARGRYTCTNEWLCEAGRLGSNGCAPGNDLLLEVLLAPVARIVGFVFCWLMDSVVKSHAAKRKKAQ